MLDEIEYLRVLEHVPLYTATASEHRIKHFAAIAHRRYMCNAITHAVSHRLSDKLSLV